MPLIMCLIFKYGIHFCLSTLYIISKKGQNVWILVNIIYCMCRCMPGIPTLPLSTYCTFWCCSPWWWSGTGRSTSWPTGTRSRRTRGPASTMRSRWAEIISSHQYSVTGFVLCGDISGQKSWVRIQWGSECGFNADPAPGSSQIRQWYL